MTSASNPLAIDLFCGLGGWTDGLLAEGYDVIGFDIEHHQYGDAKYPAQLVLQDVLTLHGSQFKDVDLIVASPPCQAYSYRAMPWKRAKALPPPDNSLFEACFRIQREASEAAGRHIPLIVENVRGAQKWVGRSRWNFGSFHLWGDVPALMPMVKKTAPKFIMDDIKNGQRRQVDGIYEDGAVKVGISWSKTGPGNPGKSFNGTAAKQISQAWRNKDYENTEKAAIQEGIKQLGISGQRDNGKGNAWFEKGAAKYGSKSSSRKAASAAIAKIPFPLSRYIAAHFKPA